MDELTEKAYSSHIQLIETYMVKDKKISIVRAFETDGIKKKKFLRSACIRIENLLLTTTFADTVHFIEEMHLFDKGSNQNKFFSVTEKNGTKSLRLKNGTKNIYITRSEAKTIYRLFNLSFVGYSTSRVLEYEYKFTVQNIAKALEQSNFLTKRNKRS